jgi:Ser/Thr protein kinase RdoA (MazF antagonist)
MDIVTILNERYGLTAESHGLIRDSGSRAYDISCGGERYFLRIVKPPFYATAVQGADIHAYLYDKGFPVPPIVRTRDGAVGHTLTGSDGPHLFILYRYIEGTEAGRVKYAEEMGALVGRRCTA